MSVTIQCSFSAVKSESTDLKSKTILRMVKKYLSPNKVKQNSSLISGEITIKKQKSLITLKGCNIQT